jgi:hypothetical protein
MTRALVVSAGRDDVLAWVAHHPAVSAHLLQRMARRLAVKSRAGSEPLPPDAGVRVARELLALADRYTVDGVVRHGLSQQQVADIVGLSRERVNKVLGDFCDRRWVVVGRGSFTLLDRAAVEARAGHRPGGPTAPLARAAAVPPHVRRLALREAGSTATAAPAPGAQAAARSRPKGTP